MATVGALPTRPFQSSPSSPTAPTSERTASPVRSLDTHAAGWLVLGAAFIVIGVIWDISWHITIGRDTFWTPAHLMIHLGGSLGGFLSGFICLDATFFRRRAWADRVIQVWGFRAPFGAWICIWGAGAMLTSAPFDNWWHNAYGLDVKILSPPHMVLALGMHGVVAGAFLLASSARNRAQERGELSPARWYAVCAQGVQLAFASILISELTTPNLQHSGRFYIASAIVFPALLTAAVVTHPFKWGATRVCLVYMTLILGMMWVLPLFAAEPKLAPVNNRVDHMVPSAFPLLLIIPALVLDISLGWLRQRRGWLWTALLVVGSATLFIGVFLTVQWFFSQFLISPSADNWFFAGHGRFIGYQNHRNEWQERFWDRHDALNLASLWTAWWVAVLSSLAGCLLGRFATRVRR